MIFKRQSRQSVLFTCENTPIKSHHFDINHYCGSGFSAQHFEFGLYLFCFLIVFGFLSLHSFTPSRHFLFVTMLLSGFLHLGFATVYNLVSVRGYSFIYI